MNPAEPSQPFPSAEHFAMAPEVFREWLKDPAHQEQFRQFLEELPLPKPTTPEMAEQWELLNQERATMRALAQVHDKMEALKEVMARPGGTMRAEDRLAECKQLLAEITDALLDSPEPHRSHLLRGLVPIREKLESLKVE